MPLLLKCVSCVHSPYVNKRTCFKEVWVCLWKLTLKYSVRFSNTETKTLRDLPRLMHWCWQGETPEVHGYDLGSMHQEEYRLKTCLCCSSSLKCEGPCKVMCLFSYPMKSLQHNTQVPDMQTSVTYHGTFFLFSEFTSEEQLYS